MAKQNYNPSKYFGNDVYTIKQASEITKIAGNQINILIRKKK